MSDKRPNTLTKKALAIILDVSPRTVTNWLNIRYYNELKDLGYNKKDRILTKPIINYLYDKLIIE